MARLQDKRLFIGMNFDDADEYVKQGDYRTAKNIILETNDAGDNGIVNFIRGTESKGANVNGNLRATDGSLIQLGDATCIGIYSDEENGVDYMFIHNSLGAHGIWKFDGTNFTPVIIMGRPANFPPLYTQEKGRYRLSNNVLNFQKERPIHSITLTESLLSWTDGFSPPKTLNLDEATLYDGQSDGRWLNQYESWLDAVKQPPLFPPTVTQNTLLYTGGQQYEQFLNEKNDLKQRSYQFIYRYKYNDSGYSVWSPPSIPVQTRNADGEISDDLNALPNNYVDSLSVDVTNPISAQQGLDQVVDKIEIAFRDLFTNQYRKFSEIDFSDSPSPVNFKNEEGSVVLDTALTNQPFSNVPIFAETVTSVKDTKVYGNYTTGYNSDEFTVANISVSNTNTTTSNRRCFKWFGRYKFGVVFVDRAGRKSGVKGAFSVDTGRRAGVRYTNTFNATYQNQVRIPEINFDLLNITVPDWAVAAHIVRTDNLKTNFFLEGISKATTLVYYDEVNDNYPGIPIGNKYTDKNSNKHIKIDISTFIGNEIVYNFSEGDRIIIFGHYAITSGGGTLNAQAVLDLKITEQRGNDLYCRLPVDNIEELEKNFLNGEIYDDNLFFSNQIFEIYSPSESTVEDIYYETGVAVPVTNPHTPNPTLAQTSFTLTEGDSWIIKRNISIKFDTGGSPPLPWNTSTSSVIVGIDYNFYAMNSNDDFFEEFDKGIGRPNIVLGDLDKQIQQASVLSHGGRLIEDSDINNLDNFALLGNTEDLPNEYGTITKVESKDNILITLCEREAVSTYILESVLENIDGTSNVSLSSKFFNNSRKMSGGWGCSHPDSVVNYGYYLYWYSWNRQSVVRYNTGNGPYPISEYDMSSYFKDKARQRNDVQFPDNKNLIQNTDTDQVLDTRADVVLGMYNPKYEMYYLVFPNRWDLTTPQPTKVGDMETIGFSDSRTFDETVKWISFYDFMPDRTGYINDIMYAFAEEDVWEHDKTNTRNNFYGTQYKSSMTILSNVNPSVQKVFNNLMIEGNDGWRVISLTTPDGQETEMEKVRFENINSQYWTDVLMDKNTLGVTQPLFEGNVMKGSVCNVKIENDSTSGVRMFAFNIFSQISERTNK